MKHTQPPTIEPLVFECDLPHQPELVWRALTERELLSVWLAPNDIRPQVGARFSFTGAGQEGQDSVDCEVLVVEPNRTLRWRQTEDIGGASGAMTSVVSIELRDNEAGGTHLRLVHGEFTTAAALAEEAVTVTQACATVVELKPRAAALQAPARKGSHLARRRANILCQLREAV